MAEPAAATLPGTPGAARIVTWSAEQFAASAHDLMVIYARAMKYPPSAAGYRADTARRHIANDGFAVRVALNPAGRPVGFAYGYTTRPGQWWHDLVHRAIAPDKRGDWMTNAFELSEMHVSPEEQGQGIGRELLLSLSAALPHQAILLSTPDAPTRAFRLYTSLGFVDLARRYLFPGDARPFAVLGARLPLTPIH